MEDRRGFAEAASRRPWTADQLIVLAALIALALLAWWWIVASAGAIQPMDTGMVMAGMSSQSWSADYLATAMLMWALMMVAMMLPSAMPMILLFARFAARKSPRPFLQTTLFTCSYLLVWTGFSIVAALAQALLVSTGTVSAMTLSIGSSGAAAALLLLVALYQFSPLKRACLDQCRSPLSFLMRLWRPGIAGSLRLGVAHGAHCLGCCWLLMLLLFVAGVMNLAWIAALTILVSIEKFAPVRLRVEWIIAAAAVIGAILLPRFD